MQLDGRCIESVSFIVRKVCVLENNPFKLISNSRIKSFSSTYVFAFNDVNKFCLLSRRLDGN